MDTQKLDDIIQGSTTVYRKGALVKQTKVGNVETTEVFGYKPTSKAPSGDNYDNVDMIFVDVVVNKTEAEKYRSDLTRILDDYSQSGVFADGPSYMTLAPELGMEHEETLRLMALGKTLGLWKIMSGKTMGMDDEQALSLAGNGFLMISGYKPKPGK
ncbi:MAG: hypothetical protein NTV63_04220 [Candidatus Woesearchaeota archaeon]|nr:hypothetical protein [Candidatus Woesearchaeota archaeon]